MGSSGQLIGELQFSPKAHPAPEHGRPTTAERIKYDHGLGVQPPAKFISPRHPL
jgi:hypothetical protein